MATEFRVGNLGKILFLVLQGHPPIRTKLESSDGKQSPRLVAFFKTEATKHARIYQRLMDHALDVQSETGKPIAAPELQAYSDNLWDEYEAEAVA